MADHPEHDTLFKEQVQVKLADGRVATLVQLFQRWLMPDGSRPKSNREMLDRVNEVMGLAYIEKEIFGAGAEPTLIDSRFWVSRDSDKKIVEHIEFPDGMDLPRVICVGQFVCPSLDNEGDQMHGSFVWVQDAWTSGIEPLIVDSISKNGWVGLESAKRE